MKTRCKKTCFSVFVLFSSRISSIFLFHVPYYSSFDSAMIMLLGETGFSRNITLWNDLGDRKRYFTLKITPISIMQ